MKKTKTVLCLILCLAFFALFALGSGESSGTSGKVKKTCVGCGGTGKVQQWYTNDTDEEPHWETCNACHGLGYYYE